MPNTSPQGRVRDRERAEKREAKRPRGDLFEGTAPHFAAPSEPPRGEQFDAGSPEPPLTIEQRRLAVRRARAHADEVLDLLGSQGVPMPLTKQRLKEVCDWGEGLLNRGVDGRPRDAVSREIQAGLDAQRDAAMDVQDARNRTDAYGRKLHPYYPFESADQERVSMALEAMQLSAQQTDALFNLLHGSAPASTPPLPDRQHWFLVCPTLNPIEQRKTRRGRPQGTEQYGMVKQYGETDSLKQGRSVVRPATLDLGSGVSPAIVLAPGCVPSTPQPARSRLPHRQS